MVKIKRESSVIHLKAYKNTISIAFQPKQFAKFQLFVAHFVLLLCMVAKVKAQDIKPFIPPSPNASSLGVYGKVPVSLFNGLPQVSIPIFQTVQGPLNLDVNLGYHGGGIRPDHHAGWVGLGWNLSCGGAITRKVNGGVDEVIQAGHSDPNWASYYYKFNALSMSNWYGLDNMKKYASPSSFIAIPAPDEFSFNFDGYSGSFFLNHLGKWQVKSSQPIVLKVEEELKSNFVLPRQTNSMGNLTLGRIFYKFTITTPNGNKYVFGGNTESIEFTRGTGATDNAYHSEVIPTSWYLTKVISPSGKEISFTYERGNILVEQFSNFLISFSKRGSQASRKDGRGQGTSISIINPVYLSEVNFGNGKVRFFRSESNELPYNYDISVNDLNMAAQNYPDLSRNATGTNLKLNIKWQKLDSISIVKGSGERFTSFNFTYNNSSTARLFLQSIIEKDAGGSAKQPYVFGYDASFLPNYNSNMLDHWGFYNGVNFIAQESQKYPPEELNDRFYIKETVPAYTASKNPNVNLMKGGILTSIKYPTGGSTTLEYEAHEYGAIAQRYPFLIQNIANTKCSGLRISKITDATNSGETLTKEYKYVLGYPKGGTKSSGILAGQPKYLDEGTVSIAPGDNVEYWYWYDHPVEPLSLTDGNHITYSEVVELMPDKSYTLYQYSNHNKPQYLDESALAIIAPLINGSTVDQWRLDKNTSLELERGKLLDKVLYNPSHQLQRHIKYVYQEQGSVKDDYLRAIAVRGEFFDLGNPVVNQRVFAHKIYSFPRYLVQELDTLFDRSGKNPVVNIQSFTYNVNNRQPQTVSLKASSDTTFTDYMVYPLDYGNGTKFIDSLKAAHIINVPIERLKYTSIGNIKYIVSGDVSIFKENGKGLLSKMMKLETSKPIPSGSFKISNLQKGAFPPQSLPTLFNVDERYRDAVFFHTYDIWGNPIHVEQAAGAPTSYQWAYQGQYPVAEVKNANRKDAVSGYNTVTDMLSFVTTSGASNQTTFTVGGNRTVVLKLGQGTFLSSNTTLYVDYSLVGAGVSRSGSFCMNNTPSSGCYYGTPSINNTVTLANLPQGVYTLKVTCGTTISNSSGTVIYTYDQPLVLEPSKIEFFYEGFEETAGAATADPFAGKYYRLGNYAVPFVKPNSRRYFIEYRSYQNGKWVFVKKDYVNNMTLNDGTAFDEIRVYPSSASMSTYTYDPITGMTSSTDASGKTIYYEYDGFGRLQYVKDQQKNIIENYNYKYRNQ